MSAPSQNSFPLVTVLVLNWNGEEIIEPCLRSLFALEYANIEVVVVDNASTDRSVDIVKRYPRARLVQSQRNLGYAGGNNLGFETARGKYVALINNDMTADPTWLNVPIRQMEANPAIGLVCSRQMRPGRGSVIDALYPYLLDDLTVRPMGLLQPFDSGNKLVAATGYVLGVNGSGIYRKAMLDELGGFDERFFAYVEEVDLSMRAFLSGWKCLYVPDAVVYHLGSVSFKKRKAMLHYHAQRNRLWFAIKFYPLSLVIRHFAAAIHVELAVCRDLCLRQGLLLTYLKAVLAGVGGLLFLWKERRNNMRRLRERRPGFERLFREKLIPLEPCRDGLSVVGPSPSRTRLE